jgi:hypothetical protein
MQLEKAPPMDVFENVDIGPSRYYNCICTNNIEDFNDLR